MGEELEDQAKAGLKIQKALSRIQREATAKMGKIPNPTAPTKPFIQPPPQPDTLASLVSNAKGEGGTKEDEGETKEAAEPQAAAARKAVIQRQKDIKTSNRPVKVDKSYLTGKHDHDEIGESSSRKAPRVRHDKDLQGVITPSPHKRKPRESGLRKTALYSNTQVLNDAQIAKKLKFEDEVSEDESV